MRDSHYEDPTAKGEVGISELQEKVLDLLEAAGIPTATNDAIIALIEAAEWALHEAEIEAENRAYAEYWSSREHDEQVNPKRCPVCGDDVASPIPGGYECLACACRWAP